jgi:hypothetical protein
MSGFSRTMVPKSGSHKLTHQFNQTGTISISQKFDELQKTTVPESDYCNLSHEMNQTREMKAIMTTVNWILHGMML